MSVAKLQKNETQRSPLQFRPIAQLGLTRARRGVKRATGCRPGALS